MGGPLSETVGRYPVYLVSTPLGALFTLGAGFAHNFVTLCFMRFLAGFCFSPSLAIASGTINDTYRPAQRAIPSTIFILMPFLGPGLGYVCFPASTRHLLIDTKTCHRLFCRG